MFKVNFRISIAILFRQIWKALKIRRQKLSKLILSSKDVLPEEQLKKELFANIANAKAENVLKIRLSRNLILLCPRQTLDKSNHHLREKESPHSAPSSECYLR